MLHRGPTLPVQTLLRLALGLWFVRRKLRSRLQPLRRGRLPELRWRWRLRELWRRRLRSVRRRQLQQLGLGRRPQRRLLQDLRCSFPVGLPCLLCSIEVRPLGRRADVQRAGSSDRTSHLPVLHDSRSARLPGPQPGQHRTLVVRSTVENILGGTATATRFAWPCAFGKGELTIGCCLLASGYCKCG